MGNFDGAGTLLPTAFWEFLGRSDPTVCWALGEHARMRWESIHLPAAAIFATREEALAALGDT
jgi:hypothetical protein